MNTNSDRFFLRNVIGISLAEFLWGLGLPVVVESTFLQLFLRHMGASSLHIGLIPFFFFIGYAVFALMSSYFTSKMAFKRGAVMWLHLVSGITLMFFGLSLVLWGNASFILTLFFICYLVFCVSMGMTIPVWLNYLVKIFSEDRSVSGLAFMMIAQNVGRLICSLLIVGLVDRYAFSTTSSGLIFIGVGVLFSLGSLGFLITRESKGDIYSDPFGQKAFFSYVGDAFRDIIKNRNFLLFLLGDLDFFVVVTVISFYANYATTFCGVEPAIAAGFFVCFIYLGAILSNLLTGTLGWFSLKHKYVLAKCCSITAVGLIIFFCQVWIFCLASLLLGFARGTRMIVLAPAVKKLSGLEDATPYFAVGPLLTLPFATFLPLACGQFLDHFAGLQATAYHVAFGVAVIIILMTMVSILKADFSGTAVPRR